MDAWTSELSLAGWLEAVAEPRPLPAGGRVASIAAAFAAALTEKVARIVLRSPARAALHPVAEDIAAQAAALRPVFLAVGEADDRAYAAILAVRRTHGRGAPLPVPVREAHLAAAATQLQLAERAADLCGLADRLATGVGPALRADLMTARRLGVAAVAGAVGNVKADLAELESAPEGERLLARAESAWQRVR